MQRAAGWWVVLAIVSFLSLSCNGGGVDGGGNGTGFTPPALTPEEERAIAFRDEALARMRDHITVTCTSILCEHSNDEWEWPPDSTGVVTAGCVYRCVPVEIDTSGEQRTFQAAFHFGRNEHGCFDESVSGTRFEFEVVDICTPNF